MELDQVIARMKNQAETIRSLAAGVPAGQARWKPSPDSWSILEVINHLLDEEREDFRQRIEYTLHRPDEGWPPIDPQGWVTKREYNQRDLDESLRGFMEERSRSLAWLEGLADPDWNLSRNAPFGEIRAGDLLAAWLAHDLLHQRQLVELHWTYTTREVEPFEVRYAGDW